MEGACALPLLLQPLIWEPGQLIDGGASPPLCLALLVTNSPTPRGLAGHMHLLCVPAQSWGEGDGNKTELFWGTSKVHFSNQKEFPSFPLMFCLCVVFGFK